jgi:Ca2+-binding EF-hand superfamily protein
VEELLTTLWSEFKAPYDTDNNDMLDRGEFRSSVISTVATQPDRVLLLVGNVANLLFGIVDTDGDGRITRDEHIRLGCAAFLIDRADAELSFDKLDTAGKGFLTVEGYLRAVTEFLTSPLPNAPGNWFLGPF